LGLGESGIRVDDAGARVGRGGGTDLALLLDRGGGTEAGALDLGALLVLFAAFSAFGRFSSFSAERAEAGADAFFAGVESAFFAFALCSVRAAMGSGGLVAKGTSRFGRAIPTLVKPHPKGQRSFRNPFIVFVKIRS
jgi:hypothetical protein